MKDKKLVLFMGFLIVIFLAGLFSMKYFPDSSSLIGTVLIFILILFGVIVISVFMQKKSKRFSK